MKLVREPVIGSLVWALIALVVPLLRAWPFLFHT
jgi:hypothetical protein